MLQLYGRLARAFCFKSRQYCPIQRVRQMQIHADYDQLYCRSYCIQQSPRARRQVCQAISSRFSHSSCAVVFLHGLSSVASSILHAEFSFLGLCHRARRSPFHLDMIGQTRFPEPSEQRFTSSETNGETCARTALSSAWHRCHFLQLPSCLTRILSCVWHCQGMRNLSLATVRRRRPTNSDFKSFHPPLSTGARQVTP